MSSRQGLSKQPSQRSGRMGSAAGGSSYMLSKMPSMKNVQAKSPFIASGLTSAVYNASNPPKDWCDVGLLIPHEGIRREMMGMVASVAALDEKYDDKKDDWKILYFAEWFVDIFAIVIHSHHENEEELYFPWIATRAAIPEKQLAKDHKDLVEMLDALESICATVIKKQGKGCSNEILQLKDKIPSFEKEMNEHLKEEEATIPKLLRDNFTQEEEEEQVQKILAKEGLHGCRLFVAAIIDAMRLWATSEFVDEFMGSMPGPIRGLVENYYIPDYKTFVHPMRDAPLLDAKPKLSKVGCCRIPFCFPCIF